MKIAYIGIDLFYNALKTLKSLGCEILEIFSCEVDNVTEFNKEVFGFAKRNNIPCQMTRITPQDIERLLEKGCEAAFCGGYYYKIPAITKLPIVNIHPSLLPIGRGSWPMAQAILWGHEKSGVTIHKVSEGFDTGDIILQREFMLSPDETHQTFMEKANALLPEMIEGLVHNFKSLYDAAKPQGEGEYWEAPKEADYTITSKMTVKEADLILRAFYGYECIYLNGSKKTVIIGGRAVKNGKMSGAEFSLADGYIKF